MNDVMADTIGREVYDLSLARVLLMPHIVKDGHCPVFSGSGGPAVVVHVAETSERVLGCRAFRDSLREEETVKTVRDVECVAMRGRGVRPPSFPLSNVVTLRWPDLNGNAFSRVEQARSRMRDSLVADETRVVVRALAWVAARYGRSLWAKSAKASARAIENAVRVVGAANHPVVLSSLRNLSGLLSSGFSLNDKMVAKSPKDPVFVMIVDDVSVPVHVDISVPEHALLVVPSGQALGEMPIFIAPTVEDYDKPERLITGWMCLQDQGVVFTGAALTNVVYLGWRGAFEMVKNLLKRAVSWK